MAISRVLDIARRGLAVYQGALDVTSNNIANASNTAYSRQRAVLSTETPQKIAGLVWGSGVTLSQIERTHDYLLERQIVNYNQSYSFQNTKSEILSQIETIFSEPSDGGLSSLMDEFFNSWQELSVSPQSATLRTDVVSAAENISSKVSEIYSDLDIINTDCISNFKTDISEINQLLEKIQNYNSQIYTSSSAGGSPNDLMDLRDTAISDLSKLVNINVTYTNENVAQVTIGGVFAADTSYSAEFEYKLVNDKLTMVSKDSQKTVILSGGDINGVADIYNNVIPSYTKKIDSVMNALVSAVNDIHTTGYTNTDPQETGVKFFDSYSEGKLVINQDILDDSDNIAISADGTEGNGDIAVQIAEIADKELIDGETLSTTYGSFISDVGTDVTNADSLVESYDQILEQLANQKASYSGVSSDEEMTNLIIYQRAYQACSKVISIENEMLETLINLV
jgi:flagellar hook-associated protein 1